MSSLSLVEYISGLIVIASATFGIARKVFMADVKEKVAQAKAEMKEDAEYANSSIRVLAHTISSILPAIQIRPGHKDDIDLGEIRRSLGGLISQTIRVEEHLGNPLTPDEINRLKLYEQRLQRGMDFSVDQAKDMKDLAERSANDHPDNTAIVAFAGMAALFLGVVLLVLGTDKGK